MPVPDTVEQLYISDEQHLQKVIISTLMFTAQLASVHITYTVHKHKIGS